MHFSAVDWHHFAVNWGTDGSVIDQYNASDLIRMLVVVPEHKQPGDCLSD